MTAPTTKAADANAPKPRRPVLETAELAAAIQAMHPEMSEAELAKQLNISTARLRQIRREARETKVGGAPPLATSIGLTSGDQDPGPRAICCGLVRGSSVGGAGARR